MQGNLYQNALFCTCSEPLQECSGQVPPACVGPLKPRASGRFGLACQQPLDRPMKPAIIIRPTAPQGFCWQIIADGKTLKSGTTATEFEARTMADAVLKEIEKEVGSPNP